MERDKRIRIEKKMEQFFKALLVIPGQIMAVVIFVAGR